MKKIVFLLTINLGIYAVLYSQPQGEEIISERQRLNSVKVQFLSPLKGHLTFAYERALGKGTILECKVGKAGIGVKGGVFGYYDKVSGLTLSVGPKFKLRPDYVTPGLRERSKLSGAYFKPELALNTLRRSVSYPRYDYITGMHVQETIEESGQTLALMLNIGKEWVLESGFIVDVSFGLGYGFSNVSEEGINEYGSTSPNRYGFSFYTQAFPIATSSSLSIGFAF